MIARPVFHMKVKLATFKSEFNLCGHIVRTKLDPDGTPYVECTPDQVYELKTLHGILPDEASIQIVESDPAGGAGGPEANTRADLRTHHLTVAGCQALIATVETAGALQALRDGETAHPKYDGGRTGVLAAIDSRLAGFSNPQ